MGKVKVEMISSAAPDCEISQISDSVKRKDVMNTVASFESKKVLETPARLGDKMIARGFKPIDATHLAITNSGYFISVDKEILNKRRKIDYGVMRLSMMN